MEKMSQSHAKNKSARGKFLFPLFTVTFLTMALTGFGQMPIYKRYYLADIPGMTWLADFYVTRYIHYIGAVILFALIAYVVFDHLLSHKKHRRITGVGYVGIFLMTGILITGVFFTIKNLPEAIFSTGVVHMINMGHMGFAVLFLGLFIFALIFRKKWVKKRITPIN